MLIRWSSHPAEPVVDSWGQFNRLFDQAFSARSGAELASRQPWVPATDVVEGEKEFGLTVELPGLKADDVTIEIDGTKLTIAAGQQPASDQVRRTARSFQRVFTLPKQVDADRIEASLVDGILSVKLPKFPKAAPRTIAIRTAVPA